MNIPRSLRFSGRFLVFFVLLGVLVRAGFYYAFSGAAEGASRDVIATAFTIGARYDIRLGLLLLLPVLALGSITRLTPFVSGKFRQMLWIIYFGLFFGVWVLLQIFDFSHYSYLGTKLAASILNFLDDPEESAAMVWQSYPVVKLILLWIVTTSLLTLYVSRELKLAVVASPWKGTRRQGFLVAGVTFLLIVLGLHGRFSQYPLRWSDAYFHPNPFVAALALNPVLNFYDTRKYVGAGYQLSKVRSAYPRIASYLGVAAPNSDQLDYARTSKAPEVSNLSGKPNIVIVLMESFSGYKSSLTGNPLDPTPFLNALGNESIVFDRFYTPHSGTARGVFATLTGLPDVDLRNTSSRNPAAVEQHSLASALVSYDAHYFIGGSTSWANVRGVIQKNIPNLKIHEEGSFKSPTVDVWGISDKSLFSEANEVFRKAERPFFSVIQTAGNHRPYTIPKVDTDFEILNPSDVELKKNGFASAEEFNAFRYMDYCVKHFIEVARQEPYFNNTIFVFLGDHGISAAGHDVGPHMPRAYLDLKLSSVHTPLIIHAPKLLKPERYSKVGSQIDVMPTVLGLTGVKFAMTGLGRDLLDSRFDDQRYAFTIYHDGVGEIGLLNSEWYYMKKVGAPKGTLHAIASATPSDDLSTNNPDVAERFNQMLDDYYQTAQYMLTHNRQQPHPKP